MEETLREVLRRLKALAVTFKQGGLTESKKSELKLGEVHKYLKYLSTNISPKYKFTDNIKQDIIDYAEMLQQNFDAIIIDLKEENKDWVLLGEFGETSTIRDSFMGVADAFNKAAMMYNISLIP